MLTILNSLRKEDEMSLKKLWAEFHFRTLLKRKYWVWWIALVLIIVLVILMTLYHKQIVEWLKPFANWLHGKAWGWIIPIVILVILSIPPLFGAEIVQVLLGHVYGLWVGFAIAVGGTLLGELLDFYLFRTVLSKKAEKLEKENMNYGCLAYIVREGGFKIALVSRLSAIPGHFTTAVFSTVGMNIWIYLAAAILSTPKLLIPVYLGYVLAQEADTKTNASKYVSDGVLGATLLITIVAGWWIWAKMVKARPYVARDWRRREKALKALESEETVGRERSSSNHETEPLTAKLSPALMNTVNPPMHWAVPDTPTSMKSPDPYNLAVYEPDYIHNSRPRIQPSPGASMEDLSTSHYEQSIPDSGTAAYFEKKIQNRP